ncbi:MAG: hypothetical protein IKP02_00745 [Paludibacteraceae bacterium]|nr:hypothetical protein [Paludibacteraceae bacterium]
MEAGIIISLILGGASIVSSICFGLIPNIRKSKIERIETQRDKLFRDIRLLYEIENELLIKLEQYGCNKSSTQKDVRKSVSDKYNGEVLSDYSKPSVYKKYIK